MQQDIKQILARYLGLIAAFVIGTFICAVISALTSCTTTKYVIVPEYHYLDSVVVRNHTDSVYLHDSVYTSLVSKGDTVFVTKLMTKYKYKEVVHIDTLLIERKDSIVKPIVATQTEYRYRTAWYDRLCRPIALAVALTLAAYIVRWIVRRKG